MLTLNLGIVAHVDAGKTSLTERLLFEAGVIDRLGSVDDGTTLTDSLDLERRRGITIRSAVAAFRVGELGVNLIDTPGHSDFIAEVERALAVLDGAVLVVSAVEGVQAQTVVLMRTLERLGLPVVVFVNKIDRAGADPERVVADIRRRLSDGILLLDRVTDAGEPHAAVATAEADPAFQERLLELVAERDDAVLEAWADGAAVPPRRLRARFEALSREGRVHAVLAGSARTGAGVPELLARLDALLPGARRDPEGEPGGVVFKIDRDDAGERQVFVDVRRGTLRVRDRVSVAGRPAVKITGIRCFDEGGTVESEAAPAGRIALVRGLDGAAISDRLGSTYGPGARTAALAQPMLQSVVEAPPGRSGAVYTALADLAEQDPFIGLRHDDARGETTVMLAGEVQKEVVQSLLAERHGLSIAFRESTVVCVERVLGVGEAAEFIEVGDNPFIATVGLRVEPAAPGSGVRFELGVELGSMPPAFFAATEQTVRATLEQGLHGWEVPDGVVTMTHSGYWPRQSHAHQRFSKGMSSTGADFRALTPLVLMAALERAGTAVHEPFERFELEVPRDTVGAVLTAIAQLEAVPFTTEEGRYAAVVTGRVPVRRLDGLRALLPGLTRGEGALRSHPDGDERVRGAAPERPRTGPDPLERAEYLRWVQRTINGE